MAKFSKPTFVIDKEICLRNIERMSNKAKDLNLRFRPHFKTHQSAKIGEWFRRFGIDAITVSSVQMAEYFANNGWEDITIAFPVNILEIDTINRLASRIRINLLVESKETSETLAQHIKHKVGIYLKIDTGYHRTGISSSKTGLINTIIEILDSATKLEFKGFLTHTGHTYSANSTNEIFSRHFDALMKLKFLKQKYLKDHPGIEISMGDTPSASICTNFDGVNELRPGNFVFYDLMQQNLGICEMEDIAVRMVCPVIAKHPSRNEIVIYGGAVHMSKDSITNVNGKLMYGRVIIELDGEKKLLPPLNYVSKLSQEHGTLKVTQNQFKNFQIGDLIEIIPVHSCLTANLNGHYVTTDGDIIKNMPKY